jgi:hypothetical protein
VAHRDPRPREGWLHLIGVAAGLILTGVAAMAVTLGAIAVLFALFLVLVV